MRLDLYLVQHGFVESREKAKYLIENGLVKVSKKIEHKPSKKINEGFVVELLENVKFVSRSGEKLDGALMHFDVDVSKKVVLDIGACSGGFTDCVIGRGAKKVYAVDVGTGQLHKKLREDDRVVNLEKTDIRNFDLSMYGEKIDVIVIDVSFISLKHVVEVLPRFINGGQIEVIALIKPQFEVGKEYLKKGIVKDPNVVENVLSDLRGLFEKTGLKVVGIIKSPLKGKEGNQEYLLYATGPVSV